MTTLKGWIEIQIKTRLRKGGQADANYQISTNPKLDHLGQLSKDQKEVTLPSGETAEAILSGTPAANELTLKITTDKHYVVNQSAPGKFLSGLALRGFVLLKKSTSDPDGREFYVRNIKSPITENYKLDACSISGLDPLGDFKILDYLFSPDGKHIFVGGKQKIITGQDSNGNDLYDVILKWGYIKNFTLVKGALPDNSDGIVSGSLIQGSYNVRSHLPSTTSVTAPALGFSDPTTYPGGPANQPGGPSSCISTTTTMATHDTATLLDPKINKDFDQEMFDILGHFVLSVGLSVDLVVDFVGNFGIKKSASSGLVDIKNEVKVHGDYNCFCLSIGSNGFYSATSDQITSTTYSYSAINPSTSQITVTQTTVTSFIAPPVSGTGGSGGVFNCDTAGIVNVGTSTTVSSGTYSPGIVTVYSNSRLMNGSFVVEQLSSVLPNTTAVIDYSKNIDWHVDMSVPGSFSPQFVSTVTGDQYKQATGGFRAPESLPSSVPGPTANLMKSSTTTNYQKPYLTDNQVVPTTTYLVTDTHAIPTATLDWTSAYNVKAVGSEKFQGLITPAPVVMPNPVDNNSLVIKTYIWDSGTNAVVEKKIKTGSYDSSLFAVFWDFILR